MEELDDEITDYNCWMREKNIKLNFIVLENTEASKAMLWQQYWNNGKRNTINAAVGVNTKHKIIWAHVFGWQNEAACIKLRNFIMGQKVLCDITDNISQVWDILKENYELAKSNYQEYLYRVPDDVYALNNLAVIYWRENNCEEAEKLFSRAIENKNISGGITLKDLYLNRGICYRDLKQNSLYTGTL